MMTYAGMNRDRELRAAHQATGTITVEGTTECTAAEAGAAPPVLFGQAQEPVAWVEKGEHGKIRGLPRDLIVEQP